MRLLAKMRETINPPYTTKKLLIILGTIVILVSIPITVISILNSRSLQPKAATPPRGLAGDLWADIIIGQPDFSEIDPWITLPNRLFLAHSVIVDRVSSPNKMYIYDAGHNRIMGLDLAKCLASTTDPLDCSADIIIGQPSADASACNGDSGFQNYPIRAPASAASLCSIPENALSVGEGYVGSSMAVDPQGNLYVTDYHNNR